MKKINFFLILIILLVFLSCKKEKKTELLKSKQMSEQDFKIERQILSFKNKMESLLKTSDSLCIDSTMWYLEITSNYTYGDATAHNENVSVDSAFISIPVTGGMISMDDIDVAYEDLIDSVRVHYYSIDTAEKHLLSVKVDQESLSSSILVVQVTSTVVSGSYSGNFTFQPWDNWMYGAGLGMCNGQYLGQDAATEIARRIMLRKAVPAGYYYYEPYALNPVYINAEFYPISGIPPSNSFSHYMWWEKESLPNFHLCIPYDELNFYLTGTEHVIYNIEKPVGYSFMDIEYLDGSLILNSDVWVHYGEVKYGILHQSNLPPERL